MSNHLENIEVKMTKTESGWKAETVLDGFTFITEQHPSKRGVVTTTISALPHFQGSYDYTCNAKKRDDVEAVHRRSIGRFNGKSVGCIPQ